MGSRSSIIGLFVGFAVGIGLSIFTALSIWGLSRATTNVAAPFLVGFIITGLFVALGFLIGSIFDKFPY